MKPHFALLLASSLTLIACKPAPSSLPANQPSAEPTDAPAVSAEQPQATAPEQEPQQAPEAPVASPVNSLVLLNVAHQNFRQDTPWLKGQPWFSSGFAVALGNGEFLTIADVVDDATYIELTVADSSVTAPVEVKVIDRDSNLALLSLKRPEDQALLSHLVPLTVGETPELGAQLELWQFNNDGLPIVTPGVFQSTDSSDSFLQYHIQSAINPITGAQTIPVLNQGKLVGISTGGDTAVQKVLALNTSVIANFLKGTHSDKPFIGFPVCGLSSSELTDPVMREYLHLADSGNGVYVQEVLPLSAAEQAGLKQGDVLLSIDGHVIDSRGLVKDPKLGPVPVSYYIGDTKQIGETIRLGILRDGKEIEVNVALNRDALDKDIIDASPETNKVPPYVIYGGLTFQTLTPSLLNALEGQGNRSRMTMELLDLQDKKEDYRKEGRDSLVILGMVLPTPATQGYEACAFCAVKTVNGTVVKNLKHLSELLKAPSDNDIVVIEINKAPYKLYLSRTLCEQANRVIQQRVTPVLERLPQA